MTMVNTVSQPQAIVSVPLGQLASVTLSPGDPRFCRMVDTVVFDSATSFIDSSKAANITAYQAVLTRLASVPPGERLLIVGHTDDVGQSSVNNPLSERRGAGALAVLERITSVWESNYQTERSRAWTDDNFRTMLLEVTGTSPSQTDIRQHKEISTAGEARRTTLFTQYFQKLLSNPASPPVISTLSPATLGCGEQHTLSTGDHEPSRRAEFFFFRGMTSSVITCPEYPRWTTPCRILPVGTPTVTIAPVETVRVGRTERVQITVNPSPLPLGATVTLELSTTTGNGAAEFVTTGSTTLEINSSQQVQIRGVTVSSDIDNIQITARFPGQATVLAQEDFTVIEAVSIFLKFEVWDLSTHAFEPLPAGIDVDIVDEELAFDDTLATAQTDTNGQVFFNLPALDDPDEAEPDIFFLVHTDGRSHAGHTLPDEWSTNGWFAADGTTPGLHDNFTGSQLGTPTAPIVYRIGLDFHARFTYRVDGGHRSGNTDPVPKGVPVLVVGGVGSNLRLRTDANGEVHGVSFDPRPGRLIWCLVDFEIEDATINLPKATSEAGGLSFWNTTSLDADRKVFVDNRQTSIGTHNTPETFNITESNRNVVMYFFKVLREWSTFLFQMTGGDWTGVNDLFFSRSSPSGVAFSWPVGRVNIPPRDHWDRETITHELSHQIMWKEVNFSTLGIAYEGIFGNLALYHQSNLLSNSEHALIEGWAEFMEAVFEGSGTPPFSVSTVENSSGTSLPLGPPPNNRGESVEGAFANGLWGVFKNQVVTSAVSSNANVPETADGNINSSSASTWLTHTSVRDRFLSTIWRPLKDLRSLSNPTSTAMLGNMRSRNTSDWHHILPELQTFNMAMTLPTFIAITPGGGPPIGGTVVTVTGSEFTISGTQLIIGGNLATNVIVTSSTTLTAQTPPGPLGSVAVFVRTAAGSSASAGSPFGTFLYANPPVITNVTVLGDPPGTPARGPTAGGTPIVITGTDFQSDATVLIGGLVAENITVISSTEITATTPLRRLPLSPGGVEVVVQNPDGQNGNLNPGFDYFLLPSPTIFTVTPSSSPASGGITITIAGDHFQPGVEVFFELPTSGVTLPIDIDRILTTSDSITAETPALSSTITTSEFVNLQVTNPDGQMEVVNGGFTYTP